MKYFLHDSNSFNDEKVTELFMQFGYEGIGLFYTMLEKIAFHEKPIKTAVLKAQLKVGRKLEKCWKFMESIGLIQSNNGETFNEQLMKYSEKYQIKKEKTAERISQWRENQQGRKNVTRNKRIRNTPKDKISKVNKSKEKDKEKIPPLEVFISFAKDKKPNVDVEQVKLKYQAWIENNWHTGKDHPISNWKSTLLNTLAFLGESTNGVRPMVR